MLSGGEKENQDKAPLMQSSRLHQGGLCRSIFGWHHEKLPRPAIYERNAAQMGGVRKKTQRLLNFKGLVPPLPNIR